MQSVDREDIIKEKEVENKQPSVTCQICSKSFSSNGTLKEHGDIHEELKMFPCLYCARRHSLKQVT